MSPRDLLIIYYLINQGNPIEVYLDLMERRLPYEDRIERTMKCLKEEVDAGWRFVTAMDHDFPAATLNEGLDEREKPLVYKVKGALSVPFLDVMSEGIYLTDNTKLQLYWRQNGISTLVVDEDNRIAHLDTPYGELEIAIPRIYRTGLMKERAYSIAANCANGYLIIDGGYKAEDILKTVDNHFGYKLFAFPSKAGSLNNKLIKQGWRLCDCPSDLK